MNTKKRIIIHVGPGKTGSSALQAWFFHHQSFLKKKGILYPEHTLENGKISSGNMRHILDLQESGKWEVSIEKVASLLKQFEKSTYSTLLLSSEFFFHLLIDIKKFIPNAEFIAYIRNPVELIESGYNQSIKRHSKVGQFIAPKSMEQVFWKYLTRVFKHVDNDCIYLRPFDRKLMQGGNIVSDLLSVIGLETNVEDERVNPSYTFESLEFKRLINHFGLAACEPRLDNLLQACNVGSRKYSLMLPEQFQTLNKQSCQLMEKFIEHYSLDYLKPLHTRFTQTTQKPYVKQNVSVGSLKEVITYIQDKDISLYGKLARLVQANPNIVVDNPAIYKAFEVQHEVIDKKNLLSESLLTHINQFTVHPSKRGKICFELACFYEENGDLENALMFAKGAYYFNPNNDIFLERLNSFIKSSNTLTAHKKLTKQAFVSKKTTAIQKVKQLLKRL